MSVSIGFLRHNFLLRSETFIYTSMRALADTGRYSVRVLALKRLFAEKFPWDDVTVLGGMSRAWYRATRWAPAYRRWAKTVSLVHAHLGQSGPFAMAAGVPFVVSYYGHDVPLYKTRERFEPWAWWYTLLRRRVFARASKILVLSRHMQRALEAQGCPSDKIAIVRLGIDMARFDAPHVPSAGPLRVLMVGREVDKKGFDDGLRACKKLVERGVPCTVTILGADGPLAPELKTLGNELGLDVAWPDPASPVPPIMAASDVLLVPSRVAANGDEEGTPTVIVEAGAARLPVVSTRHAGIPEQVDDGATGYLADERDHAGLADGLAKLADPAQRALFGEAARAKVQREYSIDAHRQRLEDIYASVLGGTSP